ncbi:phosphatase PAP2 family protein [Candidatus Bipolaricaulota bacterium]
MSGGLGSGIARLLAVLLVAWGMLLLAFFLPGIRLDTTFSVWLYWLTGTAGVTGAILIGLALVGLLVLRAPLSRRRCLWETAVHITVLGFLLGGGVLANEHLIKASLAVHRPNIVQLAAEDVLGMSTEELYSSMDKEERRRYLYQVLTDPDFDAIPLSANVRDHWIHEAGYSLPSGHTFTAMLLATYFLAMGAVFVGKQRRWILYLLPGWAGLVAWTRVLLGVHRPEDVVWGGLFGMLLGAVAFFLSYRLLCRRRILT